MRARAPAPAVVTPAAVPMMRTIVGPRDRMPGIADMGLDALQQAVAACQACKLCEGRRNTVFGVGDLQADWLVVGEAPGENEDLQGEPFVGQAGKLLDNMLGRWASAGAKTSTRQRAQVPPAGQQPGRRRSPSATLPAPWTCSSQDHPGHGPVRGGALLRPASRSAGAPRVHRYREVPLVVTYRAYLRNLPDKAKAWSDLVLAVRARA